MLHSKSAENWALVVASPRRGGVGAPLLPVRFYKLQDARPEGRLIDPCCVTFGSMSRGENMSGKPEKRLQRKGEQGSHCA